MAEQSGEEELASKTLFIQSKRFYLDVKQNQRGRFLKIAEVSSGGRKNRILMSMSIAHELCEQIDKFAETNESNSVRSTIIQRDDRKYYLDMKENDRGQFLRISMVSSTNPRTQIVIPIEGLQEFKSVLANLIDEYGNVDEQSESIESLPAIELNQLPESKNIHVGNKNFFFDLGSNSRGIFLRISEVRPNFRTSVTIPEKIWSQFRDNLNEFISYMDQQRQS